MREDKIKLMYDGIKTPNSLIDTACELKQQKNQVSTRLQPRKTKAPIFAIGVVMVFACIILISGFAMIKNGALSNSDSASKVNEAGEKKGDDTQTNTKVETYYDISLLGKVEKETTNGYVISVCGYAGVSYKFSNYENLEEDITNKGIYILFDDKTKKFSVGEDIIAYVNYVEDKVSVHKQDSYIAIDMETVVAVEAYENDYTFIGKYYGDSGLVDDKGSQQIYFIPCENEDEGVVMLFAEYLDDASSVIKTIDSYEKFEIKYSPENYEIVSIIPIED